MRRHGFLSRKTGPADQPAPLPYNPGSPEGLAARWVQWVAASGPLRNPVEDDTGAHAGDHQPDDIWFLAGSSGKQVVRECSVPAGRDLFLPVFNVWFYPASGPPEPADRAFGSLSVDGQTQVPDVIATPVPFTVAGARLNGVTGRKRPTPVTVWGLWKLVPGLAPGEHEVHAVGGDGYGFTVDVRYRLVAGTTIPTYSVR